MSHLSETQIDPQKAPSQQPETASGQPLFSSGAPVRIAITGTMGSGKSSVSAYLKNWMPVTDCDQINAQLMEKGQPGYLALKEAGVLQTDAHGNLDKQAQAAAMFSNPEYKAKVESILHPLIRGAVLQWTGQQTGVCAVEVPLLFESGMEKDFDEVWCVTCSLETALFRLQHGRGIDAASALARIEKQMDAGKKCARSHEVLVNDQSLQALHIQIQQILKARGWIS